MNAKARDKKFKGIVDGYVRKLSLSRDYGLINYNLEDFLSDVSKDRRLKYAYDRAKVSLIVGSIFIRTHPNHQSLVLKEVHFRDQ